MKEYKINSVDGDCNFNNDDVQKMYDHLVSLFHRSKKNGMVDIDSYDRADLKKLLKLPNSYK